MSARTLSRGPISVNAPPPWTDVTDQVGGSNAPFTLARVGGVGALQLAPGFQQAGGRPNPTPQDVLSMCQEIAMQRGLAAPFDQHVDAVPQLTGGMSFQADDAFVRIWVIFDGSRFVAATYVCGWEQRGAELIECEMIVRTVRFTPPR